MEMISLVVSVIFIILLFSILASSIQEILANWLSLRGAILMRAIYNLFEGDQMQHLYRNWVGSSDFGFLLKQPSDNVFGRFFDNVAKKVRSILGVGIPNPTEKDEVKLKERLELPPSYISSDAFLLMLSNMNLDKDVLNNLKDSFLKNLLIRIKDVQDKPEELRIEFEKWYNEIMGRVEEAYKRHTQLMVFFIGLTLAVVFNANMITLFTGLYKAPEEKNALYELARDYAAQNDTLQVHTVADSSQVNSVLPKFDSVIFVPVKDLLRFKSLGLKDPNDTSVYTLEGIRKNIVGWFFMAIAISFGAPFWLNLLQRILNNKDTSQSSGTTKKT